MRRSRAWRCLRRPLPPDRNGYICSPTQQCVSVCNPACGPGEVCNADGECVAKEPPRREFDAQGASGTPATSYPSAGIYPSSGIYSDEAPSPPAPGYPAPEAIMGVQARASLVHDNRLLRRLLPVGDRIRLQRGRRWPRRGGFPVRQPGSYRDRHRFVPRRRFGFRTAAVTWSSSWAVLAFAFSVTGGTE